MRPTDFDFYEYVHKYPEIMHSGIACNVNYLDPQFDYSGDKRLHAIQQLEQYANDSITAYRAIEWWADMTIGPREFLTDNPNESLPEQILKRVTKPTHYYQLSSVKIEIVE